MGKIVKRLMTMLTGLAMMAGVLFIPAYESKAEGSYSFSGVAHIQTYGDKEGTWDGSMTEHWQEQKQRQNGWRV